MPVIANGNYYLIVVTDSGEVAPDTNRTNNTAVSAATLQVAQVPLRILSASPSGAVNSLFGQFTLTFDKAIDASTFTPDDVTIVGPGGSIAAATITALTGNTFRVGFTSQNTNGTYTVTVGPRIADQLGAMMDQNNNGTPGEAGDTFGFTVSVSLADLAPSAVVVPATPTAGQTIAVNWRVTNSGVADAPAGWTERIVASTDGILGNGDDVVLGTYTATMPLAAGAFADRSVNVTLPITFTGSYCHRFLSRSIPRARWRNPTRPTTRLHPR